MKFTTSMKMLSATLLVALSTAAQAVVYVGTTVGGPTWTRPVAGSPPTPPVSGVGIGVNYRATQFTVTTSGSYVFQSTAVTPVNWDNYTFLYQTAFNPTAQFTNVLIGNDDNTTIGLSGFTYALTAGTQYFFITTGFAPGDAGSFSNSIIGPGNVILAGTTAVPEPVTWAMMVGGFGVVGGAMRYRRRKTSISFA